MIITITAADAANPDDPNEISFSKGEILDLIKISGKWWQARKEDGTSGSTYSFHPPSQ
jgi:SHO1 osmosensor